MTEEKNWVNSTKESANGEAHGFEFQSFLGSSETTIQGPEFRCFVYITASMEEKVGKIQ